MRLISHSLLAALVCSRFVQCGNKGEGSGEYKVKGAYDANNQTYTPSVRQGNHVVHFVDVGKKNYTFQPNSIRASVGDIVMFRFYPSNHSVIRAAYGYPCIPYEDLPGNSGQGFFSDFFPLNPDEKSNNPPVWNLTIKSTEPIFYYCGAPGSCTDCGMVGAINADASTPLSDQIGLARTEDFMLLPGQSLNEAQQYSLSLVAATATKSIYTVTETPATASGEYYPSHSAGTANGSNNQSGANHGLSTGAVAGIAVGSAVVALAAVGLLLLLLRTRKLKKKLDAQQAAQQATQNQQGPPVQSPMAAYAHGGAWPNQQRQMSQLPPYQSSDAGADMYKYPDTDIYDVPSRSMSPHQQGSPYSAQGQQFMPFRPGDPRNRYTAHSELSGSMIPVSELHAPNPNMPDYDGRSL